MTKNYVRAYPNYKQQDFNRITNVLMGILRETDFFGRFPRTFGYLDKFFLSYDKLYFEEESHLANGGYGRGFHSFYLGVNVALVLEVKTSYMTLPYLTKENN